MVKNHPRSKEKRKVSHRTDLPRTHKNNQDQTRRARARARARARKYGSNPRRSHLARRTQDQLSKKTKVKEDLEEVAREKAPTGAKKGHGAGGMLHEPS